MSFTIAFEGDIRKFDGNPLKTETPFGVPHTFAVGDVFEERDALEIERDELKHDIERHLRIISETLAERDALVRALVRAMRIVSDKAAGGRMLTTQTEASETYDQCRAALSGAKVTQGSTETFLGSDQ